MSRNKKKQKAGQRGGPERKISLDRRQALKALAGSCGAALLLGPSQRAWAQRGYFAPEVPERPSFFFAQMMYGSDLSWNPYPTAWRSLAPIIAERSSIEASPDRVDLKLSDPKLFRYPFLYFSGSREFDPLSEPEIEKLRLFLEYGGFMLVDDALSASGVGFDKAFQRELSRIYPGEGLTKLPQDHTLFQSFYLLDRAVGRTANRAHLSGISRGDRTVLIYSGNDLGGAWAKDRSGQWLNPVMPGGELQREMAIRLSINIIMYALCGNYKKDLIHTPFIDERRKGRKGR